MVKRGEEVFGRSARYAVVPIETVRAFNIRSDDEVVEAQRGIDDDMLEALEEMVNAARAGQLEGKAALSMAALKW